MIEQSISDQKRLRAEWRRILHDCQQPLGALARNSSPILLGLLLCGRCYPGLDAAYRTWVFRHSRIGGQQGNAFDHGLSDQ